MQRCFPPPPRAGGSTSRGSQGDTVGLARCDACLSFLLYPPMLFAPSPRVVIQRSSAPRRTRAAAAHERPTAGHSPIPSHSCSLSPQASGHAATKPCILNPPTHLPPRVPLFRLGHLGQSQPKGMDGHAIRPPTTGAVALETSAGRSVLLVLLHLVLLLLLRRRLLAGLGLLRLGLLLHTDGHHLR
jgi:hypothetical protein